MKKTIARSQVPYEPRFQRFRIKDKTFTQQYSHIYMQRTILMRPPLWYYCLFKYNNFVIISEYPSKVAKMRWGDEIPIVNKLIESDSDLQGKLCILIGLLYKEMSLKPSVS